MRPGEVLDRRFEIERFAGSGGMGDVFRAKDLASGDHVAIKVLRCESADAGRFLREAELLADLSHPGIVRHLAHGITIQGAPYLVMEWLQGEDLAIRLTNGPLPTAETLTLIKRAAEALAAVHARGVIHRDLKPSNLFLVDGDVGRIKLLDFGIAWLPSARRITQTGMMLGTPAYMSPEQARSDREIDARADVFALGCVLYECLTGSPAWIGEHVMAVLGKILFAEMPRLRERCPLLPSSIEALCARMTDKDPEKRPADGAAVADLIDSMVVDSIRSSLTPNPQSSNNAAALTDRERRVLSVMLVGPQGSPAPVAARPDATTMVAPDLDDVRRTMSARGARLEVLADGSILITVMGGGVATDQAAHAARCALELRAHLGGRPLALSTGRAELSGRMPAGDLLDRAARMLADRTRAPRAASTADTDAPVLIDEVTAGLLDARFDVVETDAGLVLRGEQSVEAGGRMLLGKATACVGRDSELSTLTSVFAECVEDESARAVVITSPAGRGKTRLAHELLQRIRTRGEVFDLWIARGDPLRGGAPFGLLGQAVARACGLQDGEPDLDRRDKLAARVAVHVPASEAKRVTEFLGEMVGAPFPEAESVLLRAARRDPRVMGDQIRLASLDFFEGVCATNPLLLLLDDMQWADRPTVEVIDAALRRLRDKPFMVLAMARPEVHDTFPKLWSERNVHAIGLRELSPKASARLIRQALGEGVSAETLDRIVTQAEGNAFYLEELIRGAAEGSRSALPETVLSMVQSRIEALDVGSRQLLRAASVLGNVFWPGALEALLGGGAGASGLTERLAELERLEWIYTRSEGRFQSERELCFRHALVREAAYGMLTAEDRALGHRLAAEWFERIGEHSAAVIAEHFDRGGEHARAIDYYLRAAAQANIGNDFGAVLAWSDRALELGASGTVRGELCLLRSESFSWRADNIESERWAREAMAALPRGSASWYTALVYLGVAMNRSGRHEYLLEPANEFFVSWSEQETTGPALAAAAEMVRHLLLNSYHDKAEQLLARVNAAVPRFRDDPIVLGFVHHAHALYEQSAGRLGQCLPHYKAACDGFLRAGDVRNACATRVGMGYIESILGSYAEAVLPLRTAAADADQLGLARVAAVARHNLGMALANLGFIDEACAVETMAIEAFAAQGNPRMHGISRIYLAAILLRTGSALDRAYDEARRGVEILQGLKSAFAQGLAVLARVHLARGEAPTALSFAREATDLLAALGRIDEGTAVIRLAYAESLFATGDSVAARAAIRDARAHILASADAIDDPVRRISFLEKVPENAQTLALAETWLSAPTTSSA